MTMSASDKRDRKEGGGAGCLLVLLLVGFIATRGQSNKDSSPPPGLSKTETQVPSLAQTELTSRCGAAASTIPTRAIASTWTKYRCASPPQGKASALCVRRTEYSDIPGTGCPVE